MISLKVKSSGFPTKKSLEDLAEQQIKTLVGDAFRYAVKISPVYSGAYRASWRVSFNTARLDVTAGRSPINPIRGAAFRWPTGFKLGDEVIISNNQPYAELIEFGWSGQAPYGVINLVALKFRL